MIFKLQIEDSLFEHYVKKYGLPKAYQVMKRHLSTLKEVNDNEPFYVIAGDDRRAIEAIFQTTIDSPAKLVKMIKRLNAVKVGDVSVEFLTDELERIDQQAYFHGKSRDQFIKDMVDELKGFMLERV